MQQPGFRAVFFSAVRLWALANLSSLCLIYKKVCCPVLLAAHLTLEHLLEGDVDHASSNQRLLNINKRTQQHLQQQQPWRQ